MLKTEMYYDRRRARVRPLFSDSPLASSAALGWPGCLLEEHRPGTIENPEVFPLNNILFLRLEGEIELEWSDHTGTSKKRVQPDQFGLVPARLEHSCRAGRPGSFMTLSLAPTFLLMNCSEETPSGNIELPLVHGAEDAFVAGVCRALLEETRMEGISGRLYSESLTSSLAMHLVRKYGGRGCARREGKADLPRRELRRAVEFIMEHLQENLSLAAMAGAAGLSPFHFSRLFKAAMGVTPYQFVLRQRIERAKDLLMTASESIAGVAVRVGFCDQSHFSSHFKRFTGVTPREFANRFHQRKNLP